MLPAVDLGTVADLKCGDTWKGLCWWHLWIPKQPTPLCMGKFLADAILYTLTGLCVSAYEDELFWAPPDFASVHTQPFSSPELTLWVGQVSGFAEIQANQLGLDLFP